MVEMTKHPYPEKSPAYGIWQFRRVVPLRLRPILRKSAVTGSLRSAILSDALPRYFEVIKETEDAFQRAESNLAAGVTAPIHISSSAIDIDKLARQHVDAILRREPRASRSDHCQGRDRAGLSPKEQWPRKASGNLVRCEEIHTSGESQTIPPLTPHIGELS